MRRVIGYLNLCLGVLALAAAALAMVSVPAALARFSAEPEDLYSSAILLMLAAVVGFTATNTGQILIRGVAARQRTVWSAGLSLMTAALLAVASVAGFTDEHPSSYELRYLLLPAAVLGFSAYLLRDPNAWTSLSKGEHGINSHDKKQDK